MSQLPISQAGDGRSTGSLSPGPPIPPTDLSKGAAQARLEKAPKDFAGDAIKVALQGIQAFEKSEAKEEMRQETEERAAIAEANAQRVKTERLQSQNAGTLKIGIANIPQTGENPQTYIDAVNAGVAAGTLDAGAGATLVTSANAQLTKVAQREHDLVVGNAMRAAQQGLIDPLEDFVRTRTTSDELSEWLNKKPKDIASMARAATFGFVGPVHDAPDADEWEKQFFDIYDKMYASYRGIQEEASRLFGTMSEAERKTSNTNLIADAVAAGTKSREAFMAQSDNLDTMREQGVLPNDLEHQKAFTTMLDDFRASIKVQLDSTSSAQVSAGLINLTNLVEMGNPFYTSRGARTDHAEMKAQLSDAEIALERAFVSEDMTTLQTSISRGDFLSPERFEVQVEAFALRIAGISGRSTSEAQALNQQLQGVIRTFGTEKSSFDSVDSYWNNTPRPAGEAEDYPAIELSIMDRVIDNNFITIIQQPTHPDYGTTRQNAMNSLFTHYTKYKARYQFRDDFVLLNTMLNKIGDYDPQSGSNTPVSVGMTDFSVNFALEGIEIIGTGFYNGLTPDVQASLDIVRGQMLTSGNSKLVQPLQVLGDIRATLERTGSPTIGHRIGVWVDKEIDRTGDKNYFSLSADRSSGGVADQISQAVLALGTGDVIGQQDLNTFVINNSKFMQAAVQTYKNIGAFGPDSTASTLAATMKSLTNRGFKVMNMTISGGADNDRVRVIFDGKDQLPPEGSFAHIATQFRHLLVEEGTGMKAVVDNLIGNPETAQFFLGRVVTDKSRAMAEQELLDRDIQFDFDFEGLMPAMTFDQHPSGGIPVIYYLDGDISSPYPVYNADGSYMRQTFDKFNPDVISASPKLDTSLTEEQKVAAHANSLRNKRQRDHNRFIGATTPGINHPKP